MNWLVLWVSSSVIRQSIRLSVGVSVECVEREVIIGLEILYVFIKLHIFFAVLFCGNQIYEHILLKTLNTFS